MDWWHGKWNAQRKMGVFTLLFLAALSAAAQLHEITQTAGVTKKAVTIVVDCGHGGVDPGKVGVNGCYEKDINLAIGFFLKEDLEKEGCSVVMVRETDTGLYGENDTNKKLTDLKNRVALMNRPQVDFIISIHQNSFSEESSRGAQVFYHTGSQEGEALAAILQASFAANLDETNHRQAKADSSYYLLKNTEKTAVIVECGFLSNREEAEKLCSEAYQKQVAQAITIGTMQYIEGKGL